MGRVFQTRAATLRRRESPNGTQHDWNTERLTYSDPVLAVPLFVVGVALLALALWSRRGRSPAARWWVGMTDDRPAYLTREPVALTMLPYFGLVAVLIGIAVLPGVGDSAGFPVLIGGVLVLTGVLGWSSAYRTFLPMWAYPSWLRPQRREERDELRQRRRGQRP